MINIQKLKGILNLNLKVKMNDDGKCWSTCHTKFNLLLIQGNPRQNWKSAIYHFLWSVDTVLQYTQGSNLIFGEYIYIYIYIIIF